MNPVEVERLRVALSGGKDEIVRDVSLHVDAGEIMGVVGESGSGKSTVALALLGFARRGARISGGRVSVAGTDLLSLSPAALRRARRELVAYVPQDPSAALNPAMRIDSQLAEALAGQPDDVDSELLGLLRSVDLPDTPGFLRRRPGELSGGQQQRVAIAMAVAARPRLIVLDEPTTGLDVSTQQTVLDLVTRLCRDSTMSTVYISHDLAVVAAIADQVAVMYGGKIVEHGDLVDVLHGPAHPYSRALLNAVPSARERRNLVPIPGRAPGVEERPEGCAFAPRCSFAVHDCTRSEPELRDAGDGHTARCLRIEDVLAAPPRLASTTVRGPVANGAETAGVLAVSSLNAYYGDIQVLFDLSLSLRAGGCVAVVGESGSGKTTMARCLIGLHGTHEGSYWFDGAELPRHARDRSKEMKRRIQYVFQNPYGSLNPRHTVADSLEQPLRHFFGIRGAAAGDRVRQVLDRVELPGNLAERYPADLSGGQRQRVAIARALACEPDVLICDEVTSALDVSVQAAVMELLRSLCRDGLGAVFVTHDLGVVRSIADSVVVLKDGHVVERGSTETILTTPEADYTKALLADTPEIGPRPVTCR